MPETMKLCGSTKSKINKDENFENVPYSGKYGELIDELRLE